MLDRTIDDIQYKINTDAVSSSSDEKKCKSVVLNIYVSKDILQSLNMKNHEKKCRALLSASPTLWTIDAIKTIIHKKMEKLQGQPYVLKYKINNDGIDSPQKLKDDEQVVSVVKHAMSMDQSLQIFVENNPGIFPVLKEEYLKGMTVDPAESTTFTMLSFYAFDDIAEPEEFSKQLERIWRPFKAYGRVYVANEGVNAQMAVPTNVIDNFELATKSIPMFAGVILNTDHLVDREEYMQTKPFRALHIRVRNQIVTDGLAEPLNWGQAGSEMDPLQWHEKITDPTAIVLDCRNSYESDVGKFENSIPLNTTFFKESWTVLDEILKDVDKDAPILTYCTGGIRCVKINAYLQQKLGFKNTNRLRGGIVSYTRELDVHNKGDSSAVASDVANEVAESEAIDVLKPQKGAQIARSGTNRDVKESRFRGMNYVFDDRMGARVTADVLSVCETCGTSSDLFNNCKNYQCNVRFIQCRTCHQEYAGCCSEVSNTKIYVVNVGINSFVA